MNILKNPVMVIMAFLVLAGCGNSGSIETIPNPPLTLALAVDSISANFTTISLTSNFNCIDCPIYKDGIIFTKITTESNLPSRFNVSNAPACYRSGGLFLFGGNIWSNLLCIP